MAAACNVRPFIFCAVNKRLDQWVSDDLVDIDRVMFPRKECKVSTLTKSSRPTSPDALSTATASEARKHGQVVARKRKQNSVEVCVGFACLMGGGCCCYMVCVCI